MSKPSVLLQVALKTGKGKHLVCWVDKLVAQGDRITLKDDPEEIWIVQETYKTALYSEINRGWNNNI